MPNVEDEGIRLLFSGILTFDLCRHPLTTHRSGANSMGGYRRQHCRQGDEQVAEVRPLYTYVSAIHPRSHGDRSSHQTTIGQSDVPDISSYIYHAQKSLS